MPEPGYPTCEDLINEWIPRCVSWPDLYGVDIPVHEGRPLLGERLDEWIRQHRIYLDDSARGVEQAAIGVAFAIKHAELEQGFTGIKEN